MTSMTNSSVLRGQRHVEREAAVGTGIGRRPHLARRRAQQQLRAGLGRAGQRDHVAIGDEVARRQLRDGVVEAEHGLLVRHILEGAPALRHVACGIGGFEQYLALAGRHVDPGHEAAVRIDIERRPVQLDAAALLRFAFDVDRRGAGRARCPRACGSTDRAASGRPGRRTARPGRDRPAGRTCPGQRCASNRSRCPRDPWRSDVSLRPQRLERHALEALVVGQLQPVAFRVGHRQPPQAGLGAEGLAVVGRARQRHRAEDAHLVGRRLPVADQGPFVAPERHLRAVGGDPQRAIVVVGELGAALVAADPEIAGCRRRC